MVGDGVEARPPVCGSSLAFMMCALVFLACWWWRWQNWACGVCGGGKSSVWWLEQMTTGCGFGTWVGYALFWEACRWLFPDLPRNSWPGGACCACKGVTFNKNCLWTVAHSVWLYFQLEMQTHGLWDTLTASVDSHPLGKKESQFRYFITSLLVKRELFFPLVPRRFLQWCLVKLLFVVE